LRREVTMLRQAIPESIGTRRPSVHRQPVAARWFYVGAGVLAIMVSVAAFAPSLFDQTARRGALTGMVVAHASFMTVWLALYLVQAGLAASGRIGMHKRLGMAAIVLAIGVVVTGYQASVDMVRRGFDLSGDLSAAPGGALAQTVFQFGGLVVFAVLAGTALAFRRRPQVHKRLMLLTVLVAMMGAPLAHLVGHFQLPGVILPGWGVGVLLALIVHDRRTLGRIHPATLGGGLGLVVLGNVQAVLIGPSQAWQRIVAWLAS
jgi:hypothetical protein